jgi:phospholipid transport system transporter-binding protein
MSKTYSILQDLEQQSFRISGELTLATAAEALSESRALFLPAPQLDIDLALVHKADSAALALLIAWMRLAKETNKDIQFHNLPAQMVAIAKASGLDSFLPLK